MQTDWSGSMSEAFIAAWNFFVQFFAFWQSWVGLLMLLIVLGIVSNSEKHRDTAVHEVLWVGTVIYIVMVLGWSIYGLLFLA
jgi:hypothetical protein